MKRLRSSRASVAFSTGLAAGTALLADSSQAKMAAESANAFSDMSAISETSAQMDSSVFDNAFGSETSVSISIANDDLPWTRHFARQRRGKPESERGVPAIAGATASRQLRAFIERNPRRMPSPQNGWRNNRSPHTPCPSLPTRESKKDPGLR
jgi:hypothetical protein